MKRGALRFTEYEWQERVNRDARELNREMTAQRARAAAPEREILAAALELLKMHPALAFAVRANTGRGYLLDGPTYHRLVAAGHLTASAARFMSFGFPGCADVIGMLRGGRFFAAEIKAADGELTDDQRAFLDAVNGGGGLGLCARSVDEIVRALE